MGDKARNALIALIALVWAVNYTATLVKPDYKPDPAINAPFLAVIGALVAASAKDKDGKDGKAGKDGDGI